MIKDYFSIALSGLRSRRLRSWLTMIGIFIGIAAVVSLIGLGEGLRTAIIGQFGFLGDDLLSISPGGAYGPPGTGATKLLTDKDVDAIANVNGINDALGRVMEEAKVEYNKQSSFAYAISSPYGEKRRLMEELMDIETEKGRMLRDSDTYAVVLGTELAKKGRFGKEIIPGAKVTISGKTFKVVGILKKKGNFMFDGAILMNEDILVEVFERTKGEYDVIGAQIQKGADADEVKENIEKLLRKRRDVKEGEEDFAVESPKGIIENVNSILISVNIFVAIIASISLVVGGIGIMNSMYTSVVERTKDIGIMKSIGAKNRSIFFLFAVESGFLGMTGGIIGLSLGILLASGLAAAGAAALGSDLIRAHFSLGLIIGSLLFSFILGLGFGTLPALQAARLHPVDALSYRK